MKNVIIYSLPLMVAGSICCATANAARIINDGHKKAATELMNSLKSRTHAAPRARVVGFKNAQSKAADGTNRTAPYANMSGQSVDFLNDEDGNVWYYTMNTTYKDDSWYSAITKAEIEIFDSEHKSAGKISIDVPDSMTVNAITPYGTITKKFFDLNDKDSEILVELHQTGNAANNYQGKYHTYVYHLDGTKAMEFDGAGVFLNIAKNSWSKYQRLVVTDAAYEAVEGKTYADGSQYMSTVAHVNIYKPASWGSSQPVSEKEFTVDEDYTYYGNDEVPVTIYNIGGDPYYVISHYSKIYDSGETNSEGYFIPTKDNSILIKTYDKNYNLVDDIDIPIPAADDTDYRMAQIGNFSDWSVSKDMFTTDGRLAYVVTYFDMTTKVDDYRYSFVAYDHTGKKINTICDGVYNTWFKLKSIPGAEEQMAFMQYVDDDEEQQQIKIVNIPSLENTKTMNAYIDDNLVSTVLNRYGNATDYKYLVKVSQGEADADNNVIAKIMWLNQNLKIDHFTKFNLGPSAENFSLTLSDTYVNPYLFNTDDKLEFFFQAKVKKTDGNALENKYMVGNEDGDILYTFVNDDNGTISSMGCFSTGGNSNELYASYTNDNSSNYNLQFYKLPLAKFTAGGDGTKDNPYIIANAGDLMQMGTEPAACYKMANNIDLTTFNTSNASWTPVSSAFTGKLDGNNHSIEGLNINSTASSVGLFGELGEKSEVKDLTFIDPKIALNSQNSTVGILAASAVSASISNVHVYDANISGDADATIGGIVGEAALNTSLSCVSFNGGVIDAANAANVGGIAGDVRTSTSINAAAVSESTINGDSNVGGAVGSAMQSSIDNVHVTSDVTAKNTVGGVLGSNSEATVQNCIFDGTVKATETSLWSGFSAAGLIGSLTADWSGSSTPIVDNNIVNAQILIDGDAADKTVHRIVGHSIANDTEEDPTPLTEARLDYNYAVDATTITGNTVSSDDKTSVEGASIAINGITSDFLTGLGFYGTETDTPWKYSGEAMPILYFENTVKTLQLDKSSATMEKGDIVKLEAYTFGNDESTVTAVSSKPEIVSVSAGELSDGTTTFTLTALAYGTADISVNADNITVICKVTVAEASGIETVSGNGKAGLRILPGNGCINAEGATSISVYSTNGSNVAKANGSSVATSQIGKGIFIVVATDANGNKQTAKVVIR